jgi:oxygen-independent coproporphyrinogen-3 oxidase
LFHRNPPSLPDDDASSDMQQQIENLLATHGYQHYETSAFAQAKHRAKHNLNYWQFGDYLGIGAGAHSKLSFHDKVLRQMRYKQPQAYMDAVARGEPVQEEHAVSHDDIAFEFMMNALRLNDGFESALFQERTSLPLLSVRRELEEAEKRGLLQRDLQRIAPTQLGQRFLNDLLEIFLTKNLDISI